MNAIVHAVRSQLVRRHFAFGQLVLKLQRSTCNNRNKQGFATPRGLLPSKNRVAFVWQAFRTLATRKITSIFCQNATPFLISCYLNALSFIHSDNRCRACHSFHSKINTSSCRLTANFKRINTQWPL